jgi:prepilin-type processing-associated H-X9-DG protein
MKSLTSLAVAAALSLAVTSSAFAEVNVTMADGHVSIVAKDATLRQILTEWARVGQTKIVNIERIGGSPMTIELQNVPESQALDVLMRSIAGYFAVPRPVPQNNLSVYDRLVVMPGTATPRAPVAASAAAAPSFPQPRQFHVPADDDNEAERNGVPQAPRGPVFNTFPQPQQAPQMPGSGQLPQVAPPPVQQTPSAFPTVPSGAVAVPGMVAPAPPQQPGQVLQPVRRPGSN